MKRSLHILLLVLMVSFNACAQKNKAYVGYYHGSGDHLLLMKDNAYYIVAYATIIWGSWKVEKDHMGRDLIVLRPKNPEYFFDLYGRYNPNIKAGYKVKFNGFEKKETFIGMANTDTMQRVFNIDPNCFNHPYIHLFSEKPTTISLVDAVLENSFEKQYSPRDTYTFSLGRNNDFIAVYHNPKDYHEEMHLFIEKKTKKIELNGSSHGFKNLPMDKKLKKEINEIIQFAAKFKNTKTLYCNPSYNDFEDSSINIEKDYSFNEAKNAYISKYNYEKDEDIYPQKKEDAYHSRGVLFKYDKITPSNITFKPFKINEKSLFTAKCDNEK
ncbi:hypothetical protein [Solitalea lacus]|uniref:hypothetical protein n=1 Tax=Solitalea lacus TaxID=2911172 RepID=UPI001EDA10F9|nr:hypothetical protein [Solitalea lacus]UKJ08599.1 hypothetical protein L2B55_05390 [Solitalea lacus]